MNNNENRDHIPPHDTEAEKCVLGAMMQDNSCIADVIELIGRDAFYLDIHQKIFGVICDLRAEGIPPDMVMVTTRMCERRMFGDVHPSYPYDLIEMAPTSMNAIHYSRVLSDTATRRQVIHLCRTAMVNCYSPMGPVTEMISDFQREALAVNARSRVGVAHPLSNITKEFFDDLDRRSKYNGVSGITSGLLDLDNLTGGFHPNELCILAARPSVGKTALAGNICRRVAGAGNGCLVFSIEQGRLELCARWFAAETNVTTQDMRKGRMSGERIDEMMGARRLIAPLPIWVNDSASMTVVDILNCARRLKASESIKMIVVDYLQLIRPESRGGTRNEDVAGIARGLKRVARELELPILCLCQLSRSAEEGNGKPSLRHLRDSGEIEQVADTVIFLHRVKEKNAKEDAELIEAIVEKQRNGPLGEAPLLYVKKRIRFENYQRGIPM